MELDAPAQLRFDYDALEIETRTFVLERAERIHNLARMTAAGIVQIGKYLSEVKDRLKHGQFLDWIEREFAWKRTTAWRFMEVFEKVKCSNLEHLDIDVSALYLIAAPSTPEPVRAEVMRRAENGEQVNHYGARVLIQRFAETGEMPEVTVSLSQMIAERRALLGMNQPAIKKMTAAEMAEADEYRARMKANTERNVQIFDVIGSIECLCGTPLTVAEIAAEIRRLDTPDKDWCGQLKQAWRRLTDVAAELIAAELNQ